MLKRKKEHSDEVEGRERKRKTQLENAKHKYLELEVNLPYLFAKND
jgi:hypothetical protein